MNEPSRYDVIIIGSGAGGATTAWRLATRGKRVLVLERGDYLPREAENWDSDAVFVRNRYKTREKWLDRRGRTFTPATHYCVGGNTKVYGAALFRLRERDFHETRHKDGVSPAWPLDYAEFAPDYLAAERLYQVHGQRGSDPTEPPCDAEYDHPPIAHEPAIAELFANLKRAGNQPFPLPLALRLDQARPQTSPCIKCATCDGFPCLLHAKADAEVICMRPALASGNVTLLTGRCVERLETSPSGREVTAVHARAGAELETYMADIVVVAGGAINSAALLLRSINAQHPHGLANSSGVVGRYYMCHVNCAVVALMRKPNPTRFQKTFGLNDFYNESGAGNAPLGHIQMLGKLDGGQLRPQTPFPVPRRLLDTFANHTIDFWLISEDLPDPDNRVTIDSKGTIQLSYRPNNLAAHGELRRRFQQTLSDASHAMAVLPERAYLGQRIPLSGVAHQCGTVRFGRDPANSALDVNCRAHDVDNLYVVDGAFFPSSGAVNPTLTIIANSLRVGDVIAERLA